MRGWFFPLLVLAFVAPHVGAVGSLRARKTVARKKKSTVLGRFARSTRSIASSEYREASPADRRFWMTEWGSVQTELLQLEKAAGGVGQKVRATRAEELRLIGDRDRPAGKNNTNATTTNKAAAGTKSEKKIEKQDARPAPAKLTKETVAQAVSAAKAGAVKGAPPKEILAPMLGMLKGVYDDAKGRIGKMNSREKKSTDGFKIKEARHKQRIVDIEAKHKNHTLSEEMYRNETRDEGRMYSYFKRSRELQHKQFHNMLKLTHGTMDREKKMINAYEAAIAGKPPPAKEVQQLEAAPEVVLIQTQLDAPWFNLQTEQKRALVFVQESLVAVRREIRYLSI